MRKAKFLLILCVVLFAIVVQLYNLNQMGRTMDEDYIVEKGYKPGYRQRGRGTKGEAGKSHSPVKR